MSLSLDDPMIMNQGFASAVSGRWQHTIQHAAPDINVGGTFGNLQVVFIISSPDLDERWRQAKQGA